MMLWRLTVCVFDDWSGFHAGGETPRIQGGRLRALCPVAGREWPVWRGSARFAIFSLFLAKHLPLLQHSIFLYIFLPTTSLCGIYSETFIHHYNVPLAHSCIFVWFFFLHMYILHYASSPCHCVHSFHFYFLGCVTVKHFRAGADF